MTRHNSLAGAMSVLMAYRTRPEGELVPVQTNWTTVVANDNANPEEITDFRTERRIRILPTVEEIMRQVATADIERNDVGQIVRIGKLRFSDGTQVEAGHKYGPGGELAATKVRMPSGAMLGSTENEARTLGGDENPIEVTASNNYFADAFGVAMRRRIAGGKRSRRTQQTHAEAKEALAAAYANTPNLPPVTACPPGLPSAGSKVADSFLGMKKAAKGDSGSAGWQDACTALVDREIWARAIDELSERDRVALNMVAHGRARTYEEVGVAVGQTATYANKRSGGRRALQRANDNLQKNLHSAAA